MPSLFRQVRHAQIGCGVFSSPHTLKTSLQSAIKIEVITAKRTIPLSSPPLLALSRRPGLALSLLHALLAVDYKHSN